MSETKVRGQLRNKNYHRVGVCVITGLKEGDIRLVHTSRRIYA